MREIKFRPIDEILEKQRKKERRFTGKRRSFSSFVKGKRERVLVYDPASGSFK